MRETFDHSTEGRPSAFSLLEVIVALGIFAGGVLVVIALFPLVTKSADAGRESQSAVQTAEALLAQLRAQPFEDVASRLQTPAELTSWDAASEVGDLGLSRCYYASLDGQRLGFLSDPVWLGHESARFFEIALVRNLNLSPVELDLQRGWLAFSLRVRWPVFKPVAGAGGLSGEVENLKTSDVGQRRWLLVSGSVRR